MEQLPFRTEFFDAVACLFNSIGYRDLPDSDGMGAARDETVLGEIARVLRPGASFIFDVPALHGMIATIREHPVSQIYTAGGWELAERWRIDEAARLLINEGEINRPGAQSVPTRYCLYLHDRPSIEALLKTTGLTLMELWEDYEGTEYDDRESDHIVVLAKK
jgi:SAM-dependent methyltransferase